MTWRMAILLIWLCAVAGPALAGAWLQEKGGMFTSASATFRNTAAQGLDESGFYAEYGATDRLTLGLDFNQSPGIASHALIFARIPLGPADSRHRFSAQLGVGAHSFWGEWWPMYKLTLSYGRNLDFGHRRAWLAIDWGMEHRTGLGQPFYKLDATLGQTSGGRIRPILQVETAYIPGYRPFWSVTPGVMIDGWTENQVWLLGVESRMTIQHSFGVKLAVWHRF